MMARLLTQIGRRVTNIYVDAYKRFATSIGHKIDKAARELYQFRHSRGKVLAERLQVDNPWVRWESLKKGHRMSHVTHGEER
jgi:hypothetical protein